jgi:hypothetical protein
MQEEKEQREEQKQVEREQRQPQKQEEKEQQEPQKQMEREDLNDLYVLSSPCLCPSRIRSADIPRTAT